MTSLRLLSSFTCDLLAQALRKGGAEVLLAPYGQFRQALAAGGRDAAVDVLLTELDAWVPDGAHGLMALDPARRRALREAILSEISAAAAAASSRGVVLLVASLPVPARPLLGYADWGMEEGEIAWIHATNAAIAAALRSRPPARFWDLGTLRAAFGLAASADDRLRHLGDLRMSAAFTATAASDLLHLVETLSRPSRKVLALDLDGTLWGGLVGEEGMGVAVGREDAAGRAFLAFQQEALSLKRRGILLVLVSKNDEAAALEVLEHHPGMLLKRSDLAAWRINWEDKASNLRAIAAELGLGLDSFAFWDDQPFERAWVSRACPEVAVAEVPADPAAFASALRSWEAFDALALTTEDLARSAQYEAAREREALKASSGSLDDYLSSLETRIRIGPPGPGDLSRLAQLFGKTNQFNLTTRRLGEAELSALMATGRIRILRLMDRFGDQGLVGVAVMEPGAGVWRITDFLLSCRVLGRQAETAFLAACLEEAWKGGASEVRLESVPTPKNAVALDFHRRVGSPIRRGEGPGFPAWIRRENRERENEETAHAGS